MTPRSMDIDTCKEIIGDAQTRVIEANAREDAESCKFNLINIPDQVSYWEKIRLQMYEPAIKHWIESTAKKLGCKATIHWKSDVVTFYPVSAI